MRGAERAQAEGQVPLPQKRRQVGALQKEENWRPKTAGRQVTPLRQDVGLEGPARNAA
jgi:hypothetical protein